MRVSAARSPHVPPPLGSAAYRRLPGEPPPPLLAPPGPRLRKSRKQFFWPLPGINVRPAPVAGGVIPARVARGVVPVPTGRAVWTRLPAPYPPTLPLPARVARGDQVGATLPAHSRRFAPAVLRLPPTNDVVPPIRLARGVVPVWAFPHAARFGLWFGTGLGTPATPLGLPEVCPDRPPALPPSDTFPPGMPTPDALPPGLADADAWPAAGDRADRFPPAAPDGDQFPAAVADPAAFPPAGVDADRFPARLAEADAQPQAAQQPAAQPATIEDSVQQTKRVEFTDGFPSKRNECG